MSAAPQSSKVQGRRRVTAFIKRQNNVGTSWNVFPLLCMPLVLRETPFLRTVRVGSVLCVPLGRGARVGVACVHICALKKEAEQRHHTDILQAVGWL
jgi:hypothetical protein